MAVFSNGAGDETFSGTDGTYDQVDYQGRLRDYTMVLNPDGSITVTHPRFGTDTLHSIEGFWFDAEYRWYSVEEALALVGDTTNGPNTGTVDENGTITGDARDNVLRGSNTDDKFYGGRGDDIMDGAGGAYNQVDYDGALADYTLSQNADGSVTVTHPRYGTDTLIDIDGLWFGGEAQWYSLADALAAQTPETDPNAPEVDPWGTVVGTDGNDTLRYADGVTGLYGGRGNDRLIGEADDYSQVSYDGSAADYRFIRRDNGDVIVDHPQWGRDLLRNIDGIWFSGEEAWYAVDTLVADGTTPDDDTPDDDTPDDDTPDDDTPDDDTPDNDTPDDDAPESTGTLIDGVITGSDAVDDLLIGTNRADRFAPGMGNDRIEGGGDRDVVIVDGDVIEWTFTTNAAGETVMSHPTWGENTLSGVERILFGRSGEVLPIADAVVQTQGLPAFRLDADDVLNGTNGDDVMRADADGTNFYGGTGDDIYRGRDDAFDQVNYDGARSEYTITARRDGSVEIDHPIWGTDVLTDIDGLVFTGREPGANGAEVAPFEFVSITDLFAEAQLVVDDAAPDFGLFG